jgi:hypothetical protein
MRKKVVELRNTKAGCKIDGKYIGQEKSHIDKCTVIISDLPFASRQVHLHFQSNSEEDHISVELTVNDMGEVVRAWTEAAFMEKEPKGSPQVGPLRNTLQGCQFFIHGT